MPRLFMAIRQEDRLPIVDILDQTPPAPRGCQWALFLRNHDELTLEMVTEEERLYMYEVYATDANARINLGIRRRLAPLLGNDRRRIELMNALLFSLQGTPVLYYGDEIGMGDNIYLGDRNGVRTPMQWNGDRNAGFSDASPQQLFLPLVVDDEYHHQSVHVAQQLANPHSLLSWMKRLIATRKRYQAFGRGGLAIVSSTNMRVLSFVRRFDDQQILVLANLSRFVQHVELDLREFEGRVPVEAFGRGVFPAIGAALYPLTIGAHACLWFALTADSDRVAGTATVAIEVEESWEELFEGPGRRDLEALLPAYVERCTAWTSGLRTVLSVQIEDAIPIGEQADRRWITILRVAFTTGEAQRYLLPLGARTAGDRPDATSIARVLVRMDHGQRLELFDAAADSVLASALVRRLSSSDALRGLRGAIATEVTDQRAARHALKRGRANQLERTRRGSNALAAVGSDVVLKLFRQVEEGPNPEIEMRSQLHAAGFARTPPIVAGFRWESRTGRQTPAWIGVVEAFVQNDGELWDEAVDAARDYLSRVERRRQRPVIAQSLLPGRAAGAAGAEDSVLGPYLRNVQRLGQCAAEMHKALGSMTGGREFAPEAFTPFSRRSAYQRMRRLTVSVLEALRTQTTALDQELRGIALSAVARREELLAVYRPLLDRALGGLRIRCHGNFHLGQVLRVGDDLAIIDFDGEPGRPLYERRLKRSPLQDVATMVRSFHYAAHAAVARNRRRRKAHDMAIMRSWQVRAGSAFVDAYTAELRETPLLPEDPRDWDLLLTAYVVERAVYEIGFELNRASEWVRAPLLDLPLLLQPPR
jgi:maltose alpha-D-glucosyltransferase/alpha-amylase